MPPADPPQDEPEAPVEVVDYDAAWPGLFQAERDRLAAVLGDWLVGDIEHVGSTAIPGMPAKPVIDIMAPVRDLPGSRPAIALAAALGYHYFPYKPDQMHWFCRPRPSFRTHHLHLVTHLGRHWKQRLGFRDALRRDSTLAQRYASLKRALAQEHRLDRETYTQAKGPFVEEVLRQIGLP